MSDPTETEAIVDQKQPRKTMKAFLIEKLQSGGQHTVKDLTAAVMEAGLTRVKAEDEKAREKKVRASVSVTLTLMQSKDNLPVVKPARGVYAWKNGDESPEAPKAECSDWSES